jgi:hypothetical protein
LGIQNRHKGERTGKNKEERNKAQWDEVSNERYGKQITEEV